MAARGLVDVALPDLEALLRAVDERRLVPPLGREALLACGLGHLEPELGLLAPLDAAGLRVALGVAIAERRERPVPRLDLVWTGPEAKVSKARDTAVVVRELFAQARREVLVGGFAFDHGADIFSPLHRVMVEHGVGATIFLDLAWQDRHRSAPSEDVGVRARLARERFDRDNWPFDEPRPVIYYDPRTLAPAGRASLHAKCLVIDRRRTLITSANFTDRGQTRNLEAGVLIDDRGFATRLCEQWWGLVSAGLVRESRLEGD